jgi:endonuclease YncB( thermonuclease family)
VVTSGLRFARSRRRWFGLLTLAGALVLAVWLERGPARSIRAADGREVSVIDGDSLRIGEQEVRLGGIDAPEYPQTCRDAAGAEWPCGREARDLLEQLVAAPGLVCTTREGDRFGRALAVCRTQAGDLAGALVAAGFAESSGDRRFDNHEQGVAAARAARRGIWRGPHQHPAEWRRANPR